MNWQAIGNFVIALAPYVVALAIGIASWIWGRNALKGKDDVIAVLKEQIASQKDLAAEVRGAKDAHIQTLEQLRPARLQQDLADLHNYYGDLVERTKQQAAEQIKELETKHNPEERKKLEQTVALLNLRLAQAEAGKEAAERLARDALTPNTISGLTGWIYTGARYPWLRTDVPRATTTVDFGEVDADIAAALLTTRPRPDAASERGSISQATDESGDAGRSSASAPDNKDSG